MSGGLYGFHRLLGEITKISAWVMPTAGISPVLASLVGLSPAWPAKVGLTVATSVVVLFVLVAVYQFLSASKRAQVNLVIALSLAGGVVTGVCYFVMFSYAVYETPVTSTALTKGFTCTAESLTLYGDKCPWLDLDELKGAEFEPTRLWTLPSILVAKLALLFTWFLVFVCFATSLGAFVRHQSVVGARSRT